MATSSMGDRKCEQQRLHKRVEGVQTTTAAAGGRCAQRPLRTAIATDGATSCCRTVFFHLVAVTRRCGGVALLRATWRRPVLVPPNNYQETAEQSTHLLRSVRRPFQPPVRAVGRQGD